jgi:protein-export membrane protein SecD
MLKVRLAASALFVAGAAIGYFVFASTAAPQTNFPFQFGLDLQGGTHLVYEADVSDIAAEDIDDSMEVLRDVIARRVNSNDVAGVLGVSDPRVQVEQGGTIADSDKREQRLIVELPGVTDIERATEFIGETPTLTFRLLNEGAQLPPIGSTTTAPFTDTGLTGRYLESAQMEFSSQGGAGVREPIVVVNFTEQGAERFAELTSDNVGRQLAIFLDGRLQQAPVIREEIPNGQATISGNYEAEEARQVAQTLNFGALPVPISLISTQSIGPSLGQETLTRGVYAGAVGLAAVALFLIAWYRASGVFAVFALSIYIAIMLALFKLIPVTLTAAGIAGFILSIGMAVDANVLIFERMKEEFRSGKDTYNAAKDGFARAWLSIRDGNISSLITAVVIFYAGTFLTKGFAVTLGLGIVVSMFTAITVTRTFLLAVGSQPFRGTTRLLFGSGIRK